MKNHLLTLGSMASAGLGLAGGIEATRESFGCIKRKDCSVSILAHWLWPLLLISTHLNETLGALDAGVGDGDAVRVGLAAHEPLPGLVTLVNDLGSVALSNRKGGAENSAARKNSEPRSVTHPVLGLSREGKLVLGLSIGDFVDPEPLVGRADKAREVPLDILNVVELASKRVIDVDDDDFPVRLALIKQCHHAEHFHLLDLASVADLLANLAHVQRVVVTLGLGVRVSRSGVLPSLGEGAVVPASQRD